MGKPATPHNEIERLHQLYALNILDTPAEERFDRLTRLAKRLFHIPIAAVSLIDENRQWFKSRMGIEESETSRDISFCGHTILGSKPLIVPDTLLDPRFVDNPQVSGEPFIRFYIGFPLILHNDCALGTLCLADRIPRSLTDEDISLLQDLANMARQELMALQIATVDELTRISNRRGFSIIAEHTLKFCQRHQHHAYLLFFDMDGFKGINNTFGHLEGDRALMDFAQILKQSFRDSDVLGRLGGDEFVVLLAQTSHNQVQGILQRFASELDTFNREQGRCYQLHASVGMAHWQPEQPIDLTQLLHEADRQMYKHKREK
ncbi:GGDEF domain-containing protein [Balneatrix alpica]|uniref:GGDEF domain-containing protein n=1 Tax=Balneatrix alpica TaxID=75684 RepID=UPI002738D446|nr:sensor domain-containing diguanylate cyclase [Balneatrix alpica]